MEKGGEKVPYPKGLPLPIDSTECRLISFSPVMVYCKGSFLELELDLSELPKTTMREVKEQLERRIENKELVLLALKFLRKYGLGKLAEVDEDLIDCNLVKAIDLKEGKLIKYKDVDVGLVVDGNLVPYIDVIEVIDDMPVTPAVIFNVCIKKRDVRYLKLEGLKETMLQCIERQGKPCYLSEYIALLLSDRVITLEEEGEVIGVFQRNGSKLVPIRNLYSLLKEVMERDRYASKFTPSGPNLTTLRNALQIYSDRVNVKKVEKYVAFGRRVYDLKKWIYSGALEVVNKRTPFYFDYEVEPTQVVEIANSILTHRDVVRAASKYVPGLHKLAQHVDPEDRANFLMSFAIVPFCRRDLKKVIVLYGKTSTGKSLTLEVLREFAGDMIGTINLNRSKGDYRREVGVIDLIGKLYGAQDEVNPRSLVDNLELIKALTGCNFVTAWKLYEGNVRFRNRATIFVTMNDFDSLLEAIKSVSKVERDALIDRIVPIRFVKHMDRSEADEVYSWVIENKELVAEWALAMARVLRKLGWHDPKRNLRARVLEVLEELLEEGKVEVLKRDEEKICVPKSKLRLILEKAGINRRELELGVMYYSSAIVKGRKVNVVCFYF